MTSEPVELEEDQIVRKFGKSFDKKVLNNEYKNGNEFPLPSRHLRDWYLTSIPQHTTSEAPHRRQALPEDCKFNTNHVLYGCLDNEEERIWVKITNLQTWFIDRSESSRGIWVESSNAYYCLKEPCQNQVGVDVKLSPTNHNPAEYPLEASLPSQVQVHLPIRAKFGLVSNLVDIFAEAIGDVLHNYAPIHAKRTAKEIHALLTPSDKILNEYNATRKDDDPILHKEPFDLSLLQTCPEFVKVHMLHFHTLLDESSGFIKGLDEIASSNEEWTPEQCLKSAMASEKRSQRTPWGDVLPQNRLPVRPNLLIQLEMEKAAASVTSNGAKEDESSDDDDDIVVPSRRRATAKPAQQQVDLEDSSDDEIVAPSRRRSRLGTKAKAMNDDLDNDVDDEKQDEAAVEASQRPLYSEENMLDALKQFSSCMDPTPAPDESGKWEDVEAKQFAIDGSKGADVLKIVQKEELPSLELMLLIVSCLRQSCQRKHTKVLKKFFLPPKEDSEVKLIGAKIIGDTWREHVLKLLEIRHKEAGSKATGDEAGQKEAGKATEELVLRNIILFIPECYIIKDGKQLGVLKSKYDLDWNYIIQDTMKNARRMIIRDLIAACFRAQNHVLELNKSSSESKAEDSAKKSEGSTSVTEAVAKAKAAAAAASAATEALRKESQADQQKKDKEDKSRGRNKRLQDMMEKAKSAAGLAAFTAGAQAPSSSAGVVAASPPKESALKTTGLQATPSDPRSASKPPPTNAPIQSQQAVSNQGWGRPFSATQGANEPSSSARPPSPTGWGAWKTSEGASWGGKPVNRSAPSATTSDKPSAATWGRTPATESLASDVTRDESAATARQLSDSLPASTAPTRNDNQPGVQLQNPAASAYPGQAENTGMRSGGYSQYAELVQSTERFGSGSAAVGGAKSSSYNPSSAANVDHRPSQPGRNGFQDTPRELDRRDSYQYQERKQEGRDRGNGEASNFSRRASRPNGSYNRADTSCQAVSYPRRDSYPESYTQQRGENRDGYSNQSRRPSSEGSDRSNRRGNRYEESQRSAPDRSNGVAEPPSKRPRNDTNAPAARMSPSVMGGVAQGGAGLGRGRGRGRTLPAWMTKQQDGLGGTASSAGDTSEPCANVQPAALPQVNSGAPPAAQPPSLPPAGNPSWNSGAPPAGQSPSLPPAGNPAWNAGAPPPNDDWNSQGRGRKRKRNNRNGGRPPRGVTDDGGLGAAAGRGRGRGRGKDVNKPAWMTHGML